MDRQWNDKIFNVDEAGFETLALEIFEFQWRENQVYRAFCNALGRTVSNTTSLAAIPFLPVSFFKTHQVTTTPFEPKVIFESSGTSGMANSRHLIRDTAMYEQSFVRGFERVYGPVSELVIIGLLPSYLERTNSSLVYMVNKLIQLSGHPASGFYLNEMEALQGQLLQLESNKQKSLLIGVTFALLDFAELFPMPLDYCMVVETGGMKGRRTEMIRAEVQEILQRRFRLGSVHSEYGMTELLSQAWSTSGGRFNCPPWMKVLLREEEDPLSLRLLPPEGTSVISGAVNIIDLANIYSCSFIAIDDAARIYTDGSFEILGRLDNSDLRGCSLLTA